MLTEQTLDFQKNGVSSVITEEDLSAWQIPYVLNCKSVSIEALGRGRAPESASGV